MFFRQAKKVLRKSLLFGDNLGPEPPPPRVTLNLICSDDLQKQGFDIVRNVRAPPPDTDVVEETQFPTETPMPEEDPGDKETPPEVEEEYEEADFAEDEFVNEASQNDTDTEDVDLDAEMKNFEANLHAFHPTLKDMWRDFAEEELMAEVHARRNPMVAFNSNFVMAKPTVASKGAGCVPPVVGVTGHVHKGGNIGLNGVYELRTGLFNDRPVYQKTLEKRLASDLQAAPSAGLVAARMPLRTWEERILSQRSSSIRQVKRPAEQSGLATMWPTPNVWFLYFDRGLGCWCIGPKVGHYEIYAMCPGTEEFIPDKLDRWQVWDCGLKTWYSHKRLRTFKGCR